MGENKTLDLPSFSNLKPIPGAEHLRKEINEIKTKKLTPLNQNIPICLELTGRL